MDTLIGTSIGGYRLIQSIGSGGMGTVYLAEDVTIGQQVAIKIIRTDSADIPDASAAARALERFKQEARAVASLDHLHILPLYRYGEEQTNNGQRAYMVMQYRPEGSLWDWLRHRAGFSSGQTQTRPGVRLLPPTPANAWPLSLTEAGEYLQQAASALQYAHERGIIHRDIKPANFLLRVDDGRTIHLLLSDFGLAKFFAASSATSSILGTPTYMAPEQFEGIAGPATDQYALAIMIYLFLAGHPPFEGEPLRLMHQHLMQEPPPIRVFVPTLPQGIEPVLAKALAKKPADRYPSIAEFAHAFQLAKSQQSRTYIPPFAVPTAQQTPDNAPTVAQPQPSWTYAQAPAPTSTPDNAPTVAQPSLTYSPPSPFAQTTTPDNAPTVAQLSFTPNRAAGIPPAFVSDDNAPTVAQPPLPTNVAPDNAPTVAQPFVSPLQPNAAFASMAPSTSSPAPASIRPSANTQTPSSPSVFAARQRPSVQPPSPPVPPARSKATAPAGSQPQKVSRRGALGLLIGGVAIVVVGGVGAFLYLDKPKSTTTTTTTTTGTHTTSATAKPIVLQGHTDTVTSVHWSPDGTQLVSSARDNTVRIWSIANQQTIATYTEHQAPVLIATWSSDGTLLASGGADQTVRVWTPAGTTQRTFFGLGADVSSVVWESGTALLAGTLGLGDYILSLNNKHIRKGSFNAIIHALALSPDGQFLAIAFGDGEIGIINLRKQDQRIILHKHNGAALSVAWSSDGTLLATGGEDHKAFVLDATTGNTLHVITDHGLVNGVAWDPTGNGRFATACSEGHVRVWNLNANTHSLYNAGGAATSVSWSASGLAAGSQNHNISIWKV